MILLAVYQLSSASAQDIYSERSLELFRQLQCPVCAGQTIAESQSDLARTMRGIVEEKVRAGESNQQILQYFADRYGNSVLVDPPKSGIGLGLWWIPPLVVLLGVGVVVAYLRERTARPGMDAGYGPVEDDDELEAIAREILSERPRVERSSQA